jgi:hypothetical protein
LEFKTFDNMSGFAGCSLIKTNLVHSEILSYYLTIDGT